MASKDQKNRIKELVIDISKLHLKFLYFCSNFRTFLMYSYLQYLYKSTNAHGVHSPFVYSLVTECIYLRKTMILPLKTMFAKRKYELLLNRLRVYFQPKNILELSNKEIFKTRGIVEKNPSEGSKYDILYMGLEFLEEDRIAENYEYTHNNTMWIVEKNQTEKSKQLWKAIQKDAEVRVTVDLYALGLVFFRKEQVKQNFIIRF